MNLIKMMASAVGRLFNRIFSRENKKEKLLSLRILEQQKMLEKMSEQICKLTDKITELEEFVIYAAQTQEEFMNNIFGENPNNTPIEKDPLDEMLLAKSINKMVN